jgi:hypothetical protein
MCGAADDDTGHATGGCPALEGMYTARHHAACRVLLAAVEDGIRGGCVRSADVGNSERCASQGVEHADSLEGSGLLTPRQRDELKRNGAYSVPDLILAWTEGGEEGAHGRNGHSRHGGERRGRLQIHLVEVKYCRDTDPEAQRDRAAAQHAELIRTLQTAAPGETPPLVQLHVIVLGAGGSLFKDTPATLASLGVPHGRVQRALTELHMQAVESLTSIMATRQRHARQLTEAGNGQQAQGQPHRPRHGRGVT